MLVITLNYLVEEFFYHYHSVIEGWLILL